ncbi:ATP-binding cassette domain-containing protein [Microbacterium sp. W1N]|uniref:ATP-binding cassette domain-containing protein n=1 Tax=Microbacterium festucae TaxID=2977531 RepID=UPI0021BE6EE1|nr:ATP-binding cassette domain-containing protein [Microbacterium festucae]MCT9820757.1 ATP-binding cassette domain-containing protein [Microbacterium festucae]
MKAAAVLAAAFIAVRVVYRVLFHGADGAGAVVLPLPLWRLPAPFAHVELLGPATVDGLWTAAVSAVPIALTILAFGLLSSVIDIARLLSRAARSGPFRGLARALAVAWATLPSLADAVRAARLAARLRGERAGVRLLAPVLQRAIERATAVAAALELRGYAGRGLEGDCTHPVVLQQAAAGFGSAGSAATVCADDLALAPGTLTLLTGDTGSGKTTLLRALSGLHSHLDGGWLTGRMQIVGVDRAATPPRDTARTVGVVLQHPREGFATARVDDEIALALELRGVAAVIRTARVAEVAGRLGITALLGRDLRGLSAGEATLVAIAAAVVDHPILLLVDEPLADLDRQARARIVAALDALAHTAGVCVVVAEHRADAFAGIADGLLRVADGRVAPAGLGHGGLKPGELPPGGLGHGALGHGAAAHGAVAPGAVAPVGLPSGGLAPGGLPSGGLGHGAAAHGAVAPGGLPSGGLGHGAAAHGGDPSDATRTRSSRSAPGAEPAVLDRAGITVRHGAHVAVRDAAVTLFPREIVALTGPNGAGKSSLLIALATGERTAALVPDASDDLFVRDTVRAECRRADRRAARDHRVTGDHGPGAARAAGSRAAGSTAGRFAGLLGLAPADATFTRLLDTHPRDLSAGQRRCLAIALQTARHPAVLLVDEPTRGLDPAARALVANALVAQADAGAAVLIATHDAAFVSSIVDRVLPLAAGSLSPSHPVPDAPAIAPSHPVPDAPAVAPSGAGTAAPTGLPPADLRTIGRIGGADEHSCGRPGDCCPTGPTDGPAAAPTTTDVPAVTDAPDGAVTADSLDTSDAPDAPPVEPETPPSERRGATRPHVLFHTIRRIGGAGGHSRDRRDDSRPTGPTDGSGDALHAAAPPAHRADAQVPAAPGRTPDAAAPPAHRPDALVPATPGRTPHAAAPPAHRPDAQVPPAPGRTPNPDTSHRPTPGAAHRPAPDASHRPTPTAPRWRTAALVAANVAALAAFCWPLVASAVPAQAQAAVPYIALAIAPLAVLVVLAALDTSVRSAHTLAHLAVLAALGAAVRIASTGVGGVEALFVLLILAGRAFGPRFGLLLGAASIAVSAVLWGGVGPWLPFQMFACGWVGAGAGLLPRRVRGAGEIAMLCVYGIAASYLFGLLMNLWFWPFAVGGQASISYVAGAPLAQNVGSFLVYSLVTSTAGWDTLRAITTVIGVLVLGRVALSSLRRARPVAAPLTTSAPLARVTT